MQSRQCSGVVLAGGASTRFGGQAKGLLLVGGERVVDRVIAALTTVTDEQMLIVNDRAVRAAVCGIPSHPDVRTERGGIVGVHSALTHCRGAALVVAWDMPFVAPALLAELRRQGEQHQAAVFPEGEEGPEPLCAYYPRSCLSMINRQIEAGKMRLSDLIDALPNRIIVHRTAVERFGSLSRLFANLNTAADLTAARQLDVSRVAVPPRSNLELV
jgi:molybdopterin-guanine dinucleotide biosynthesis protein A